MIDFWREYIHLRKEFHFWFGSDPFVWKLFQLSSKKTTTLKPSGGKKILEKICFVSKLSRIYWWFGVVYFSPLTPRCKYFTLVMMRVATSSLIFQARARAARRVSNIQVLHRLSSGSSFQERWKLVETVYKVTGIRPLLLSMLTLWKLGYYLTAAHQQGAPDMLSLGLISWGIKLTWIWLKIKFQWASAPHTWNGVVPRHRATRRCPLRSSRGGRNAAGSRQLSMPSEGNDVQKKTNKLQNLDFLKYLNAPSLCRDDYRIHLLKRQTETRTRDVPTILAPGFERTINTPMAAPAHRSGGKRRLQLGSALEV